MSSTFINHKLHTKSAHISAKAKQLEKEMLKHSINHVHSYLNIMKILKCQF